MKDMSLINIEVYLQFINNIFSKRSLCFGFERKYNIYEIVLVLAQHSLDNVSHYILILHKIRYSHIRLLKYSNVNFFCYFNFLQIYQMLALINMYISQYCEKVEKFKNTSSK